MIKFIYPKALPHISTGASYAQAQGAPRFCHLWFLSLTIPQLVLQRSAAKFIAQFFAQFPDFDYDPTAPVNQEYRRLRKFFFQQRRSEEEKKAFKSAFGRAMGKQFASFYGASAHDIRAWRALCVVLSINPIPKTIEECKSVRFQFI